MIYLSLGQALPPFLELSIGSVVGAAGPDPARSLGFPSGFLSYSFSAEAFFVPPSEALVSLPLPVFSGFSFSFSISVFEPVPVFLSFPLGLPGGLPNEFFSLVYSPAIPVLSGVSLNFSFPLPDTLFSFAYFPPPADYFRSASASVNDLDYFSSPGASFLVVAPVALSVGLVFPPGGLPPFLSSVASARLTSLFPWLFSDLPPAPVSLPPAVSSSVIYAPSPGDAADEMPVGFLSGAVSAVVVPPASSVLALNVPSLGSFSAGVLVSVYQAHYISIPQALPVFPPPPSVSPSVSPGVFFEAISLSLQDFSVFSSGSSPSVVPGFSVLVSEPLPDFSFLLSDSVAAGPAGAFVSFLDYWCFIPPPPSFFIPPVLAPSLVSFPLNLSFDLSAMPAVVGSAVWRVGVRSLTISVLGKVF